MEHRQGVHSTTWKTTATVEALHQHGAVSLCKGLSRICPNGVVQSTKLKAALGKVQPGKGGVNYTKKANPVLFDQAVPTGGRSAAMHSPTDGLSVRRLAVKL